MKTMTTNLALVAAKALPALSGSSVTYNADSNAFITQGYTSCAGNTYYRVMRISDRLVVCYNLGQGYCHTFLNSIVLYAWNGSKAEMISQRSWGGCDWKCFNEYSAKLETIDMLKNYLSSQAKMQGQYIPEKELHDFSSNLVNDAYVKRIG